MSSFVSGQAAPRNFDLPTGGNVPEWIELLPPGRQITGRDGRSFVNADPAAVIQKLNSRGTSLVVDYEHATELKAPKGEESPAAGWIDEYQLRAGGALWGRVSWTPRGRAAVLNREYRYLSPVIIFSRENNVIHSLGSIALTNTPNLNNTALNHAVGLCAAETLTDEEKRICVIFGNSPEEVAAIKGGGAAMNAQQPGDTSDDEEKIRRLLGISKAEAEKTIAKAEKGEQAAKLLTADELKICEQLGVDPVDFWNERVKEAGLDPEKTTYTGHKYDNKGTRL